MLTDAEFARLPDPVLQDIVLMDRRLAAASRIGVVPFRAAHVLREMRAERAALAAAAHKLYGRAPLQGENGPGRPTAGSVAV